MPDVVKLPNDLRAERAVLGAVSLDPVACMEVFELVGPTDFYVEAHQVIFSAMRELVAAEQPPDIVVLTNKLREEGMLERAGGAAYLSQTVDEFPDLGNVEHYARIVRDKAVKRQLMAVAQAILVAGGEDSGSAAALLQEAQEGIYKLAEETAPSRPVPIQELAPRQLETALRLSRGELDTPGLSTGWETIDSLMGGLYPGEVVLVAARTSVGKSTFAIDLARRVAADGKRVLYASTEMRADQLTQKVLGCMAQVNTKAFRQKNHRLEEPDHLGVAPAHRIEAAIQELGPSGLHLWAIKDLTPMALRTRCRQMKAGRGLDLVVVDYVQQMFPDTPRREVHEGYMEISGALSSLAGDLDIPVVGCAQLNRNADTRDKDGKIKPPLLSEIGGSTRFEQDAHAVVFLSRDVADQQEMTDVILAKSRLGETGKRRLVFNLRESRFDQTGALHAID
jgi:replicative DNA helicase